MLNLCARPPGDKNEVLRDPVVDKEGRAFEREWVARVPQPPQTLIPDFAMKARRLQRGEATVLGGPKWGCGRRTLQKFPGVLGKSVLVVFK